MVTTLSADPYSAHAPVSIIHPPMYIPDYGDPVVPQIEEVAPQEVLVPQEVLAPEPLDHYSVAQAKAKKPAPRRHMHVVRARPNFFEKLVAGFIKIQQRQAAKNHFVKRTRTTSRRG